MVYYTLMSVGRIEVITGSMFSGKTEELIRRVRRALFARLKVQAFKPKIDNRYSPIKIVSHGSLSIEAVPLEGTMSLAQAVEDETHVVALDEAQFFHDEVVGIVDQLADAGKRVIIAGLDMDFAGNPFGPMPALMAIAEEVTKVRAVCTQCGADASRSQRLSFPEGRAQVQVGGSEAYEARCRACHEPGSFYDDPGA